MKSQMLYNTDQFRFYSIGNGTAYHLISKDRKKDIFLQGGDAVEFFSEFEAHQESHPDATINAILSRLWFDYEAIAQDIKES